MDVEVIRRVGRCWHVKTSEKILTPECTITDCFVISSVTNMSGRQEVKIFPATEDFEVIDWLEIVGGIDYTPSRVLKEFFEKIQTWGGITVETKIIGETGFSTGSDIEVPMQLILKEEDGSYVTRFKRKDNGAEFYGHYLGDDLERAKRGFRARVEAHNKDYPEGNPSHVGEIEWRRAALSEFK